VDRASELHRTPTVDGCPSRDEGPGPLLASEFDYELPPSSIAQSPPERRDSARLLVDLGPGRPVEHRRVRDLPAFLGPGDLVVINDTRVMASRLRLHKETGGAAEVVLLEDRGDGRWDALVRPGRRLPPGTVLSAGGHAVVEVGERAEGPAGPADAGVRVVRVLDGAAVSRLGELALPPYVKARLSDPERYQVVYGRRPRSVAAPTAGLHLTFELLERCRASGAEIATVELAVGLGTFRPMASVRVEDHRTHSEAYHVPRATLAACEQARRVVAIGTTTVRALESAALTGVLSGRTDLFIRSPFEFKKVDVLLTNFHLPRSTLLVLVDAFMGSRWRVLYADALASDYRFLSFGDAMLVARPGVAVGTIG
jgi:S-adenosylmethionine:tRNA ribosyltransferase-isomerase